MKRDAEALLLQKFPARVLRLEELLRSPEFNIRPTECHAEINVPRPSPVFDNSNQAQVNTCHLEFSHLYILLHSILYSCRFEQTTKLLL